MEAPRRGKRDRAMHAEDKRARKINRELEASLRLSSRIALKEERSHLLNPKRKGRLAPSEAEKKARALERVRRWRAKNPERNQEHQLKNQRDFYARHPNYDRDWKRKHPNYHREYNARKRAEKLEAERAKVRAYKKAWRRANKERELARGREESKRFRATNPESVRRSQRKYRENNRDYFRQFDRDRYAASPQKFKARSRAQHAINKDRS